MDSYFTNWTNQNDNHSCIDQALLPYNLIEQNPRKDLSNKILDTALYGQVKKDKYCQAVMFTATMTSSIYIGGIGKPAERVKLIIIMYS
ncbi:unnamed protein product [Rotaria sp. Silwood2]|nr:unnamed protein product [Rotaria sp. Silwood2]